MIPEKLTILGDFYVQRIVKLAVQKTLANMP